MSKTRTFIAVAAEDQVVARAERAITRLRRYTDHVKWVERDNLHWTLHFLGEIDDQEVYEVCQAVEQAVATLSPFDLAAAGVGAFPSLQRPKTLWMGTADGTSKMVALHAALEEQLRPLGFRGERRQYVPHLTLGRVGRGMKPAEAQALTEELAKMVDFEGETQRVGQVTVYASRLRREGADYSALATFAF